MNSTVHAQFFTLISKVTSKKCIFMVTVYHIRRKLGRKGGNSTYKRRIDNRPVRTFCGADPTNMDTEWNRPADTFTLERPADVEATVRAMLAEGDTDGAVALMERPPTVTVEMEPCLTCVRERDAFVAWWKSR